MMAIDQRGSLRRAIAKVIGRDSQQITSEDLTQTKTIITKILAPYATAV
jgi:tagatose-1,6-bisphosphate aldolase